MTKRDFFVLIIKIFGLFFLVNIFSSGWMFEIASSIEDEGIRSFGKIFGTALIVGVFLLLIFRPHVIIEILSLDKGFDSDKIEVLNFNSLDLLKVATIIVGGLLFLDWLPALISHTINAVDIVVTGKDKSVSDISYWTFSCVNVGIGYWLVKNYQRIAEKLLNIDNKAHS